jgi:hypothetical protein
LIVVGPTCIHLTKTKEKITKRKENKTIMVTGTAHTTPSSVTEQDDTAAVASPPPPAIEEKKLLVESSSINDESSSSGDAGDNDLKKEVPKTNEDAAMEWEGNHDDFPMRTFQLTNEAGEIKFLLNPVVSAIGILILWGLSIWCMSDPTGSREMLIEGRGNLSSMFTWFYVGTNPAFMVSLRLGRGVLLKIMHSFFLSNHYYE